MAWGLLILGGCFEVGFTTCLRFVDGFRHVGWTLAFLLAALLSLALLEIASRSIPLGTAYAVWTGIGALGTVVIGMIWFGEPANAVRIALILGLVGCIVGLKLVGGGH
ncbi:DMT family transporter [Sphingomonas solaris]|uniref:Guanidinium exporter n=1 Tax=Alterirhizorhabdus solaris TaxID=2529389 RepID=A0A558QYR2_9SPHN|nr:multidrug efflux SMR transporter [Sphingomonas solaris]TVV72293.1 multidrug efflux SMR transporter [Sphingomonas solaris]